MATVFKPTRPYPLPPNPEIIDKDGKPHVRLRENGKAVLYPVSRDGAKYLKPAKRWYIEYRDENHTLRRVKGFTDRKATEARAAELERKTQRARVGLYDPAEEHARRPLADHLRDYAVILEAKGTSPAHIKLTVGQITALFTGCGFVFPSDADAGKAAEWLNALRRDRRPVPIPGDREGFTPGDVARLLGVTTTAVSAAVKRHGLEATGKGPGRRLPRATVDALALNAARGAGPKTVNHYVQAVRSFFRWLVAARRLGTNPLETLALANPLVDVRRARRELTADELRVLLAATLTNPRTFRGLTGEDRFHLYLTAAATGFRANALANLTRGDFDLDADTPTVTLAARFNKSRKPKVQPIPAEAAEQLRSYLPGKPAASPVWGGTWASDHRGAEMLRGDLERAGIPYAVEGPDGPEYADFHSLRHSYLTMLGRHGVDLRTAQELAGHTNPQMTARYSHRRLHDLAGAVERLPSLLPPDAGGDAEDLRATGTDGMPGAVPGAVPGGTDPHRTAPARTLRVVGAVEAEPAEYLENMRFRTARHQSAQARTDGDEGAQKKNHRGTPPVVCAVTRPVEPNPSADGHFFSGRMAGSSLRISSACDSVNSPFL